MGRVSRLFFKQTHDDTFSVNSFTTLGAVKGVARFIFNTKINVVKVGFEEEFYRGIRKSHYVLKITYLEFGLPSMGNSAPEILEQVG